MAKNNVEFNEETIRSLYHLTGNDVHKLARWFKKVKLDISVELIEAIVNKDKKNEVPNHSG